MPTYFMCVYVSTARPTVSYFIVKAHSLVMVTFGVFCFIKNFSFLLARCEVTLT